MILFSQNQPGNKDSDMMAIDLISVRMKYPLSLSLVPVLSVLWKVRGSFIAFAITNFDLDLT